MTIAKTLAIPGVAGILVSPAVATDSICKAVALHATTETGDFQYPLERGTIIDAITQYNVNKKTGVASFCSHGDGCYPAEALRLTDCRVDKSKPEKLILVYPMTTGRNFDEVLRV